MNTQDNKLQPFILVVAEYLKRIPRDLQYIFIPTSEEDIKMLAINICQRKVSSPERRKVFDLVEKWKFPLKYRKYSLKRIKVFIKILELKERKKYTQPDNLGDDNTV